MRRKREGGAREEAMGRRDRLVFRRSTGSLLCFAWWALAVRLPTAAAVWLTLPPWSIKCVTEEIHAGVVSLADYSVIHEGDPHIVPTISVRVSDPNKNVLYHNENSTIGQFAFTTNEPGTYLACFWQDGQSKGTATSVSINWRIGIQAKDWESIARREKIEGVELELRKLEEAVLSIHENLMYLQTRESKMSEVSERTNTRVARFSMMSLGVCILAAAVQLWLEIGA